MTRQKPPPVVAELGRPETPDETTERKAASRTRRREGQTLFNLIVALVASLGAVLVLVLVVVRPDAAPREPVDYRAAAAEAGASVPLAAPELPEGWYANAARFEADPADGVVSWYIGFVTPDQQFVALRQGVDANPSWVANQLPGARADGTELVDGVEWAVYDQRGKKDVGNFAYAMTTTGATSSYVLFGTADRDEFEVIARALAPTIGDDR